MLCGEDWSIRVLAVLASKGFVIPSTQRVPNDAIETLSNPSKLNPLFTLELLTEPEKWIHP